MSEATIMDSFMWIVLLSGIPLLILSLVGTIVSIFGAMFQVNDQSVSFAVKTIVFVVVLLLGAPLMVEPFCAWGAKIFGSL